MVGEPDDVAVLQLASEVLAHWQGDGVDTAGLAQIDIRIADLGGTMFGLASGNTIWLDDNAADWGWFADPTPGGRFRVHEASQFRASRTASTC